MHLHQLPQPSASQPSGSKSSNSDLTAAASIQSRRQQHAIQQQQSRHADALQYVVIAFVMNKRCCKLRLLFSCQVVTRLLLLLLILLLRTSLPAELPALRLLLSCCCMLLCHTVWVVFTEFVFTAIAAAAISTSVDLLFHLLQ